jgi:hypothetical protein
MTVAIVALVAAMLNVSTAHAGWKIDRAKAIAAKAWNDPCDGNVVLRWADQPHGVHWGVMWTRGYDCEIGISNTRPLAWEEFCTTLLHEYGHLAGFRDPLNVGEEWHSRNPRSVMYADNPIVRDEGTDEHGVTRVYWHGVDRRCRDRGRPYLGLSRLTARRSGPRAR